MARKIGRIVSAHLAWVAVGVFWFFTTRDFHPTTELAVVVTTSLVVAFVVAADIIRSVGEAGVPDELVRPGEPADVAHFTGDCRRQVLPDAGHGAEELDDGPVGLLRGLLDVPTECRARLVAPLDGFEEALGQPPGGGVGQERHPLPHRFRQPPLGRMMACGRNTVRSRFKMAEGLEADIIGLNDPVPATPQCPFGGMEESGLARELGREGLEAYLETKYVSLKLRD